MAERCLLYYITDRAAFAGTELARRDRLLEKIAEAAHAGIDYIQLREKDLSSRDLESLARDAVRVIRENAQLRTENQEPRTSLLINSRTDVALAVQADGVHLRADDISPQDVKTAWKIFVTRARSESRGQAFADEPARRDPMVAVSCHSVAEVSRAVSNGATFAVFAPIFEKKDSTGTPAAGLVLLAEACRAKIPVLALGGITLDNARSCLDAGAVGIAAIRLFQENPIAKIVARLRH